MVFILFGIGSSKITTPHGRTDANNFGKFHNIDDLIKETGKCKNGEIGKENFEKIANKYGKLDYLQSIGMRFLTGVIVGQIDNGLKSLINNDKTSLPIVSSRNDVGLGKNTAKYFKHNIHIGEPVSTQLRRIATLPNIDYNEKTLASSSKDYQQHEKRKNLTITSGFDRKRIVFFMEDTFMSVKDYLLLYNDKKQIQASLKKSNGIITSYGCAFKTKNKFKFTNTLEFYDTKLILHLVKITDLNVDVRELIEDITNNKKNSITSIDNEDSTKAEGNNTEENNTTDTNGTNSKGIFNNLLEKLTAEIQTTLKKYARGKINDIEGKMKEELDKKLRKFQRITRETSAPDFGRIPEDEQYSDPITINKKNKFKIEFETSLKTKLTDSSIFNEQAKIVRTWYKSLSPGSIWEVNLTHHFGQGINLNHLYDLSYKNKEHPAGYIFILEQIGDRRGRIRRLKDNDLFTGYAPTEVHVEFDYKFAYLTEERNGTERTATYRKKKREEDFEETDNLFQMEFCPDRESKFNVEFDNIKLNRDSADKKSDYLLEYDTSVLGGSTNLVSSQLASLFESYGIDPKTVSEDEQDFKKHLKRGPTPTKSPAEYEGTGGNPPNIINHEE